MISNLTMVIGGLPFSWFSARLSISFLAKKITYIVYPFELNIAQVSLFPYWVVLMFCFSLLEKKNIAQVGPYISTRVAMNGVFFWWLR